MSYSVTRPAVLSGVMRGVVAAILCCTVAILFTVFMKLPPRYKVTRHVNTSYDYIIVGAGSAGSVLANRLSEESNVTVLLLEAGDDESTYPSIDVPLLFGITLLTSATWHDFTVSQKHSCQDIRNQQCYWPHGKVLGGTSSLNCMIYIRGSRHDYDKWAANGCEGWSYKDVLPYFIKAEDNQNEAYVQSGYHGRGGPLPVSDYPMTEFGEKFLEAMEKDFNIPTLDVNAESQYGFTRTQITTRNGHRASTAATYLRQAMHRPNLHIATNSFAVKVTFDGVRANGVEFIRDGVLQTVNANKEVIVSAGPIGSPKLLLLSGIGPRDHLEELNISMKAVLPVGNNLQDHLNSMAAFFNVDESVTLSLKRLLNPWTFVEYFLYDTGPLSRTVVDATGFVRTKYSEHVEKYPDIQYHVVPYSLNSMKYNFIGEYYNEEYIQECVKSWSLEGFIIFTILLHPKSRGTVRLRSSDPLDSPLIDPNYLDHPDDVKVIAEGVKLALKYGSAPSLASLGTRVAHAPHKACVEFALFSDDYLRCYVRQMANSIYHPSSTCRMGRANDPNAVVDPQLRVRGVRNLRVVDSSIMPSIVSGNLNAPTIMIAEKAADLIRGINSVKDIPLPEY